MPYILTTIGALAEGAASVPTIDFTDAFSGALNNISGDFVKYAGIAIGVGLAIWGAPKAIQIVKKFFSALTR